MIEVEHVSKRFTYSNPDPNSNDGDMWFDYLLGMIGRNKGVFAARRRRVTAVDDISFTVQPGEFFGLLGPNGAGKSTLVKMISTILTPTSGAIRIAGHDTRHDSARARASLSVVPSNGWLSFDSHLTVSQNLEFWGRLFGMDTSIARQRTREALDAVGLGTSLSSLPTALSSGMRQRLAIAKGLLVRAPVFVLDEPTANVDPISSSDIQEFIRSRLNKDLGQTVLMTTHNMVEAERLCDRIGIVNRGQLVACDAPAALLRLLEGRVVELAISRDLASVAADLRTLPVIQRVQEFPTEHGRGKCRLLLRESTPSESIAKFIQGAGMSDATIRLTDPDLEDLFFALTRHDVES
ncbi:MAG TPA: ABC transporter ATP-binding protein [Thermomicrobiales bacterium]|nr:ABC transporter ATP-binding protein [Thermomicrobiales bacterium]